MNRMKRKLAAALIIGLVAMSLITPFTAQAGNNGCYQSLVWSWTTYSYTLKNVCPPPPAHCNFWCQIVKIMKAAA